MITPAPNDHDVAFQALFARHFGELTRLARLLGAGDPEDVAHEAFLRLRARDRAACRLRATVVRLSRKRRIRATGAGLDALPRRQREVLVLRYGLDLGTPEIAEALGRSPATVETVIRRGLQRLEVESRPPAERPLRRVAMVAAPVVAALVVATSVLAATQLIAPGPQVAATSSIPATTTPASPGVSSPPASR
ncbi:sigma-70 family RNA polymerase sigma factor [Amycolatopsis sp. OK19-0408]|uniref:Sigma-70 family RNA polymerase sigma factor n=1 Tax=Amycolatopsis iheyensis TaxID=2945988 RepID=A0A9X2NB39_9PSEU|nr:sigma-70 family RNA polymerase sigma factor [Amycolatopsis iheyensis]MCR6483842.1 sigma-70 family RNA polymerase sigma factor [Amycolatopsis iheyensis]